MKLRLLLRLGFLAGMVAAPSASAALIGFGVTGAGDLFSFDPDQTATPVTVGNLGFVPEGIDFRPAGGSAPAPVLYAIDVGRTTTQLYTINTATGLGTPVGPGFATTGADYSLAGAQTFGFDFNPRTLQGDGSVRIRLVSSTGVNLRLNSDTGLISNVDTSLADGLGAPRGSDAAAYLNTRTATAGGATTLYVIDATANSLNIVNPPNNGVVNAPVGLLGVTVDANPGIAFDIYTDPLSADDTIGGDRAFAAFTRPDTNGGNYLFYDINLATGSSTGGRKVGGGDGLDFIGGLAIIPEPSVSLLGLLGLGVLTRRRRQAC